MNIVSCLVPLLFLAAIPILIGVGYLIKKAVQSFSEFIKQFKYKEFHRAIAIRVALRTATATVAIGCLIFGVYHIKIIPCGQNNNKSAINKEVKFQEIKKDCGCNL